MSLPETRTVTLYTRAGCGLCLQAHGILRELAARLGFAIELVDIESDDELLRRFMFEIPVIAAGETILASAPIRRYELEDALAALWD